MERLLWGLGGEKCRPISDPPGSKGTGEGGGGGGGTFGWFRLHTFWCTGNEEDEPFMFKLKKQSTIV